MECFYQVLTVAVVRDVSRRDWDKQPVVRVWRRTGTGEAPRGQGATAVDVRVFVTSGLYR